MGLGLAGRSAGAAVGIIADGVGGFRQCGSVDPTDLIAAAVLCVNGIEHLRCAAVGADDIEHITGTDVPGLVSRDNIGKIFRVVDRGLCLGGVLHVRCRGVVHKKAEPDIACFGAGSYRIGYITPAVSIDCVDVAEVGSPNIADVCGIIRTVGIDGRCCADIALDGAVGIKAGIISRLFQFRGQYPSQLVATGCGIKNLGHAAACSHRIDHITGFCIAVFCAARAGTDICSDLMVYRLLGEGSGSIANEIGQAGIGCFCAGANRIGHLTSAV